MLEMRDRCVLVVDEISAMRWLCVFFPCQWLHHFNVSAHGVYQCQRCKMISIGASRP